MGLAMVQNELQQSVMNGDLTDSTSEQICKALQAASSNNLGNMNNCEAFSMGAVFFLHRVIMFPIIVFVCICVFL